MEEKSLSDEEQQLDRSQEIEPKPKKDKKLKVKADIHDPNYQGEMTPKNLLYGPLDKRKCTNICMLIFFLLFWAGIWAIAFRSYKDFNAPEVASEVTDQFGTNIYS